MSRETAVKLWNARANNTLIPISYTDYPTTEADAYEVQSQMIEVSGLDVIGWKIGATVEAMFELLGVTQPFAGPLFEQYVYESGADVPIMVGHKLESEITIQLKSPLPYRTTPYSRDEVAEAVAAIIPSLEIVGSRSEGEFAGAGFRLIADGGVNVATIVGNRITDWQKLELESLAMTVLVNGENVGEGNSSALVWEQVLDALIWITQQPPLKDRGLLATDLVMTGTCTGVTDISAGDSAVVDFGVLGQVSARFC